jgi:hypothetical protein
MALPAFRTTPAALLGASLKLALVAALVVALVPSLRERVLPHVEPALNPWRKMAAADQVTRIGRFVEHEARVTRREPLPRDLPRILGEVFPGRSDVKRDPWGEPFFLRRRGDGFEIGSAGPDRIVGTPDDILSRRYPLPRVER